MATIPRLKKMRPLPPEVIPLAEGKTQRLRPLQLAPESQRRQLTNADKAALVSGALSLIGLLSGRQDLALFGASTAQGIMGAQAVEAQRRAEELAALQKAQQEALRLSLDVTGLELRKRQLELEQQREQRLASMAPLERLDIQSRVWARLAGIPTEEERQADLELRRSQAQYYARLARTGGRSTQPSPEDLYREQAALAVMQQGLLEAQALAKQMQEAIQQGRIRSAETYAEQLKNILQSRLTIAGRISTAEGFRQYQQLLQQYEQVLRQIYGLQPQP